MWIAGLFGLFALVAGSTASLNRQRLPPIAETHWDLGGLGVDYAMILASLGGFTVTGAIFLAELRDANGVAYSDVIALFLIAFVILTGTSVTYATLRNAIRPHECSHDLQVSHRVMYMLSTTCFFLGISLSLLGLLPLLVAIELPDVAATFGWLLMFVLVSGGARLGAWMHSLLGMDTLAAMLLPFIAFGGAVFYRVVIADSLPWLWPDRQATLSFSMTVFVFTAAAFFVETSMIRFQHRPDAHAALRRLGPSVLPPLVACGVTAIFLVWLSLFYPLS